MRACADALGAHVHAQVIDESLIAGFIVEYGSSQIDLSVKGQLDKITAELQSNPQLATA
jgi:F-type H+-transporting ATPase subunit delta